MNLSKKILPGVIELLKTKYNECTGCGLCSYACPKKCINMIKDKEGFLCPQVDSKKCINCDLCNKVCPVYNKNVNGDKKSYYLIQLKDEKVLKSCASGGAFYGIAEYFLKNNGIVYGVSTNSKNELQYKKVEKISNLLDLVGSKYYQCNIDKDVYADIIKETQNRIVLVSGTPCQISAIKNSLKINLENLYTFEILCQGVPNDFVIKKYYNELEKKKNQKIEKHIFRSKDKYVGRNYLNKYVFSNNEIEYLVGESDPLSLSFQRQIFLRESCYNCKYACEERVGDFVSGDYWEKDILNKNIKIENGVSALLCNSNKADILLNKIDAFNIEENRNESIFSKNIPFHRSVKRPIVRSFSYKLLKSKLSPSTVTKICCYKYYLKKIIKGEKK